jgi:hypothetical protein
VRDLLFASASMFHQDEGEFSSSLVPNLAK